MSVPAHPARRGSPLAAAASILAAVVLFAVVTVLVVGAPAARLAGHRAAPARRRTSPSWRCRRRRCSRDPGALESPASGRQLAVEVIDAARPDPGPLADARARAPARRTRSCAPALRQGRTGVENIDARPAGRFACTWRRSPTPAARPSGGAVLVASDTSDISHTISNLGRGGRAERRRGRAAGGDRRRGADPARAAPAAPAGRGGGGDRAHGRPVAAPARAGRAGRDRAAHRRAQPDARRRSSRPAASERRFLADASHELRTPVTSLLGNVEYAARHGADPEVLDDLRHDAARLARLVDALLALERAGGDRRPRTSRSRSTSWSREVVAEHDPRARAASGRWRRRPCQRRR